MPFLPVQLILRFAHRAGLDGITELADKLKMPPENVVRIALKGMFAFKAEIIPGFLNILFAYGARHLFKPLIESIGAGSYQQSK